MHILWPKKACSENPDRKSTRLNSSHDQISYAVFCLKKKKKKKKITSIKIKIKTKNNTKIMNYSASYNHPRHPYTMLRESCIMGASVASATTHQRER